MLHLYIKNEINYIIMQNYKRFWNNMSSLGRIFMRCSPQVGYFRQISFWPGSKQYRTFLFSWRNIFEMLHLRGAAGDTWTETCSFVSPETSTRSRHMSAWRQCNDGSSCKTRSPSRYEPDCNPRSLPLSSSTGHLLPVQGSGCGLSLPGPIRQT